MHFEHFLQHHPTPHRNWWLKEVWSTALTGRWCLCPSPHSSHLEVGHTSQSSGSPVPRWRDRERSARQPGPEGTGGCKGTTSGREKSSKKEWRRAGGHAGRLEVSLTWLTDPFTAEEGSNKVPHRYSNSFLFHYISEPILSNCTWKHVQLMLSVLQEDNL